MEETVATEYISKTIGSRESDSDGFFSIAGLLLT